MNAQIEAPLLQQPADIKKMLTMVAAENMRRDFRLYCQRAWPQVAPQKLDWNWHLDAICDHLVYVSQFEIRYLMICIPPRHTKSLGASVLWPTWEWIEHPKTQFLTASVDDRLALDFSRLSRRVIESPWYQQKYPHVRLLDDENQGMKYRNTSGGQREAVGIKGRVTGSGGDIQVLDDAHDAAKVESDAVRQSTINWHDNAWRSRLNNPKMARKVYIGQRTHDGDVYGHVMAQEPDRWVKLILPVEFDKKKPCITYLNKGVGDIKDKQIFKDPRKVEGELLAPRRFGPDEAKAEKNIMTERAWNAQYLQTPEGAGGLILKRHWWKQWVYPEWHEKAGKEMPTPDFWSVLQFYDTAFEEDEEADFTARTTWGLFNYEEFIYDEKSKRSKQIAMRTCAMLLDMLEEKLEYPECRQEIIDSANEFQPDEIFIEKKASGHSLIQELRRKNLPVRSLVLTGSGGRKGKQGDLIARAHESSLMLEKGCIFYVPRTWSYRVIDHCAKFPAGEHDDITSSCTLAWQYMRRYYDLQFPDEAEDQDDVAPFHWKKQQRRYA